MFGFCPPYRDRPEKSLKVTQGKTFCGRARKRQRKRPQESLTNSLQQSCNFPLSPLQQLLSPVCSPTIPDPGSALIAGFIEPTLKTDLRPLGKFRKEQKRLLRTFYSRLIGGGPALTAYITNSRSRLLSDYYALGLLRTAVQSALDFSRKYSSLTLKQQELQWASAFYAVNIDGEKEEAVRKRFRLSPTPYPTSDMQQLVFFYRDELLSPETALDPSLILASPLDSEDAPSSDQKTCESPQPSFEADPVTFPLVLPMVYDDFVFLG